MIQMQQRIEKLEQILNQFVRADRYQFDRTVAHTGSKLGLYSKVPILQPSTSGSTGAMTTVGGAAVTESNGFKGYTNAGTAYTIGDVVGTLKAIGLLAP